MAKYTLQLKQSVVLDDVQSCFDTLLQVMDKLFADGFLMTRIERNNYYFENHDNGKKVLLRVLKGKCN